MDEAPSYLEPYLAAARKHGGGFGSLLWASPKTQGLRFAALMGVCDFAGVKVLDAGCGRADFLDYLLDNGIEVGFYTGLEAVEPLAAAAQAKGHPRCAILRGDFIREPQRLAGAGAEVIVFSGSLNTLSDGAFAATLRAAYAAAGMRVAFNFLSSPMLANAKHLTWRSRAEVLRLARTICAEVTYLENYLPGDCTVCLSKGR